MQHSTQLKLFVFESKTRMRLKGWTQKHIRTTKSIVMFAAALFIFRKHLHSAKFESLPFDNWMMMTTAVAAAMMMMTMTTENIILMGILFGLFTNTIQYNHIKPAHKFHFVYFGCWFFFLLIYGNILMPMKYGYEKELFGMALVYLGCSTLQKLWHSISRVMLMKSNRRTARRIKRFFFLRCFHSGSCSSTKAAGKPTLRLCVK